MIFCVPVKNGWQFEQISTLISPPVDLVLYLLPQAQCTATSRYTGWIPFFIIHTPYTSQSSAFAHSKARHCTLSPRPDTSRMLPIHRLEKLLIGLGAMQLVHQKLHGFHRPKRTQHLAQYPHLIETILIHQQFFFSRPGLADIDSREEPLVGQTAIEMNFHVTGPFELFKDHIIHPAT